MCSGAIFVKIRASKFINLSLCMRAPCEVTSIIAYPHPSSTARRKNFWIKNRPGIDILYKFGLESEPILNLIVFETAVLYPASSKIALRISVTDVLPLVPVTAITFILREGKPYIIAAKRIILIWYVGRKLTNKLAGTSFLIW